MPSYVPPHKRRQLKEQQSSNQTNNNNNNFSQRSNNNNFSNKNDPGRSLPQRVQHSSGYNPSSNSQSFNNSSSSNSFRSNNNASPPKPQQQVGRGRFGKMFEETNGGYGGDSRNNNRGGRGGYNSGGFGNYGSSSGYSNKGNYQAQKELSTTPNKRYEEELFGKDNKSTNMEQGINFDRYNDIPVEVSGQKCPDGIEKFESVSLNKRLKENIKLCGYRVPTPIQKFSIPCVMESRDLMACAQTGSGKTAAFLIPTIHMLLGANIKTPSSGSYSRAKYYPSSLILSPTRELAQQIHVQAQKFLYCTGMRAVCVYGGSKISDQFRELSSGCHILVATPGRLWDMIERGRMSLSCVRYCILDEADRMLDMGFEPQIRMIVEKTDIPKNKIEIL
eukprot:UN30193